MSCIISLLLTNFPLAIQIGHEPPTAPRGTPKHIFIVWVWFYIYNLVWLSYHSVYIERKQKDTTYQVSGGLQVYVLLHSSLIK